VPKYLPGPNLHFRIMKNCVNTSLLGSLVVLEISSVSRFILIATKEFNHKCKPGRRSKKAKVLPM
jgi:hypothetical protein